jgi:hypothetical protein
LLIPFDNRCAVIAVFNQNPCFLLSLLLIMSGVIAYIAYIELYNWNKSMYGYYVSKWAEFRVCLTKCKTQFFKMISVSWMWYKNCQQPNGVCMFVIPTNHSHVSHEIFVFILPLNPFGISKHKQNLCFYNRIIEWKRIITKSMEMTNFEFSIGISSCFNFIHYIIDNRINPQHNRYLSRYWRNNERTAREP